VKKKICALVLTAAFSMALFFGCGALENIVESDPIVDLLGLDYSACVADVDSFDTCFEFLRDNDQALLGADIEEEIIRLILESLDENAIPTVSISDL